MKRTLLLFIVSCLTSCENRDLNHIDAFNTFVAGVSDSDIKTVKSVSTETTAKVTEQMFVHSKLNHKSHVFSQLVDNVSQASRLQSKVVIIRDSISDEKNRVWIWFYIDNTDNQMIVQLIRRDERWLVDIPLFN